MEGRRIERVPVVFGPFKLTQATVVAGPFGGKTADAVLGAELLSLFNVSANERELTIASK